MASELKPWRYEIKCGPDDEASHAWIYDEYGEFTAVMKIHKAKQIVDAMNTRPAHAATDTGLERYRPEPMSLGGMVRDPDGGYVTRSQAEELLATERARYVEASQRAANEESLKDTMHRGLLRWKERAEKAEAELVFIERVKGVNEKYANSLAFLEMTENDDPEEFAECFWNKFIALEADNAAQAARIKELEEDVEWAQNAVLARQRHAEARCEALEAKLAAAERALEQLRSDCQSPIDMYERNGPEFTSPQGNEYESTSYAMAKFAELVASVDAARAVLGGKP